MATQTFMPKFFTQQEWKMVRILADLIIPRDEHSGSATDAGVPEFLDFMMIDSPQNQGSMRNGLKWFNKECKTRFGHDFLACSNVERATLLDAIAWPKKADAKMQEGVGIFNALRDLVASGYYSSKVGVEDLKYIGNVFVSQWTGCPSNVLDKLKVRAAP